MERRRILVIEDDEGVRSTICRMLVRFGYEPIEAVNGLDGVDALRRTQVDLVLTDLVMPEQEGIETIRQIKELRPRLPIIAMTGWFGGEFSTLADALARGADRGLEKPFRPDELLSLVRDLLDRSAA